MFNFSLEERIKIVIFTILILSPFVLWFLGAGSTIMFILGNIIYQTIDHIIYGLYKNNKIGE